MLAVKRQDGSPFIVAEVAQAHDGSLGSAHAYIDLAAGVGADAVKFQTHIADAESTEREPFRVRFSRQDASRRDYWRRMEFTADQWRGLADHAAERGLVFLSSAFSPAAVDLLGAVGMLAWKVGSGEVTNLPLLRRMAATGRPVWLSSGMSSWADLDAAVATVRGLGAPVAVFQCTTAYPCPAERLGLNVLAELRARYGVPVGLSDHSATPAAGIAAAALGVDIIEAHIVFSPHSFGPDTPASLTPDAFKAMVDGVRFVARALAHPVDKAVEAAATTELRTMFGRSVVAARPLSAGTVLGEDDLALKKPGGGWPPDRLELLMGRVLRVPLALDAPLSEDVLV